MRCKVWNDNKYPFSSVYLGDKVTIPAGSYVEMEYMDAVSFMGKMPGIKRDVDGAPDPKFYQMLRREDIKEPVKEVKTDLDLTCMSCSYKSTDQVDLAKHILDNHAGALAERSRDEAGLKLQEALRKGK